MVTLAVMTLSPRAPRRGSHFLLAGLGLAALAACGDDDMPPGAEPATHAVFSAGADLSDPAHFYDIPFPSDLRLDAQDSPDLSGLPNPDGNALVAGLASIAVDRRHWPVLAVGHFLFDGELSPRELSDVILPSAQAPVVLLDVDADSPELGRTFPTVADTPAEDDYVPAGLLAVAARPGFMLHPNRRYAFVVTSALKDIQGKAVAAPSEFAALRDGKASGPLADHYAALWPALEIAGVARSSVVSAAIFTTGDAVAELAELGDAVRQAHTVSIESLAVDPDDGADHPRFCELKGTVTFPQFQRGQPPFDTEGLFEIGADGLPVVQRQEIAPVSINLPKQPMPPGGYPLVMYFHGSGGLSDQVVDRGKVTEVGGETTKGEGPAHVLAAHGFATVGSAHPLNPERLPGASEIAYLNFDNLKAFRDTFRQGVLEQRLYLDALLELSIDPTEVASCDGLSLPVGETSYHFASSPVLATGQSMGGLYANLISATEPRIEAVVPTGAGGLWSMFILLTDLVGGEVLVPILLGSATGLAYTHPAMNLLTLGLEPAEPLAYMPRLGHRPLPGHPARSVYEPVGKGDIYFATELYDAIALAYGHQQAGEEVWPTMQQALALDGLDGLVPYPIEDNLTSEDGRPFTGVVVQYEGDGIYDPHGIYGQLDAVKHQYGCFLETFYQTGHALVPAPAPLGSPCQ